MKATFSFLPGKVKFPNFRKSTRLQYLLKRLFPFGPQYALEKYIVPFIVRTMNTQNLGITLRRNFGKCLEKVLKNPFGSVFSFLIAYKIKRLYINTEMEL